MKKLLIVLFPFIVSAQFSKNEYTEVVKDEYRSLDSVEYYFIQLLNEYRRETYPNIPSLTISTLYSQVALHHTKYLFNMQSKDFYAGILTHDEPATATVTDSDSSIVISYRGTDTLLNSIMDRAEYYDPNGTYISYNEVVQTLGISLTDSKMVAKRILDNFLNSPGHKLILDEYEYTHIGISIINQKSYGSINHIFVCIRPCALSSTMYLRPNTFFPYHYGNK